MGLTERVKAVVGMTFGADVASIADDASSDAVDGWDSMGHVTLIGELERTFNVCFTLDEATRLTTIQAICHSLQNKGIQ